MFSRFLKYIIPPFSFRVFFRRIFYSNLSKVPFDKPLLFIGNHQNSFMDGMLVGAYLPQPLHFLMRADMFSTPLSRYCLRELNVAPVYRVEEGIENVHKNLETFTGVYNILKDNGNLVVFSEGICVQEKRLQKLRKGTARMAFGAEKKYGLDVQIIPVGINYTYPSKFRKEVMISFHEPFSIKEFKEIHETNPAKALLAFNERINKSLREEVIIVDNPEDDWLAEQLLTMERNDYVFPVYQWIFYTDERRLLEKNVCDKINYISKTDKKTLAILTQKVKAYIELLNNHHLKDESFSRDLDYSTLRYLTVIVGIPVFLAGYLGNLFPFIIPKFICDKLIKDKRFYSSVYVSTGTVLYLIYLPALLILLSIFFGWAGFFSGLLVPLFGYLTLFYQEIFQERITKVRFLMKSIEDPKLISEIAVLRKDIFSYFEKINTDML